MGILGQHAQACPASAYRAALVALHLGAGGSDLSLLRELLRSTRAFLRDGTVGEESCTTWLAAVLAAVVVVVGEWFRPFFFSMPLLMHVTPTFHDMLPLSLRDCFGTQLRLLTDQLEGSTPAQASSPGSPHGTTALHRPVHCQCRQPE